MVVLLFGEELLGNELVLGELLGEHLFDVVLVVVLLFREELLGNLSPIYVDRGLGDLGNQIRELLSNTGWVFEELVGDHLGLLVLLVSSSALVSEYPKEAHSRTPRRSLGRLLHWHCVLGRALT